MRVKLENESRGLLKTFGVMFGKRFGGFKRRAEEIIRAELAVSPEFVPTFEALMQANPERKYAASHAMTAERIKETDAQD